MESLPLFVTHKEKRYFFIILFFIFTINLSIDFHHYKQFISQEIFQTDAKILNIYHKQSYDVLKLKTKYFKCFTSTKNNIFRNLEIINVTIISKNIDFLAYMKGFYTNSFNIIPIPSKYTQKKILLNKIYTQHQDKDIASLYGALYLATPLTQNIRELCNELGVSHLVAISGFHLGAISLVLYFLFHFLYNPIHQNYFPYRNKKYDIMLLVSFVLFNYLIFLDLVPSFLRAFVMFLFAIFLLRNNIKVLSIETLLIATITIIAIYPHLLFSLSLWFSVAGVFYIFLFLQYFATLNKTIQFILFNFWIYLAINPITHLFFGSLSKEQLLSPILTILFSIFYPISILLHFIGYGGIFDNLINDVINAKIYSISIFTPNLFFYYYVSLTILSVFYKNIFILLNISFILYNIWLYHFIF